MNTQERINFLRSNIHQIKPAIPYDLELEDDFKQVWGLDSLDLMEFVARIEQNFRLLIPDQDLERMSSLQAVVNYLDEKLVASA